MMTGWSEQSTESPATTPHPLWIDPDMRVTGRVRVILTLNLGKRSFRGDPDKTGSSFDRFRQLRGTRELAHGLRNLKLSGDLFLRDPEMERLQREGYEAGVFTQYLLDHELMPRYELVAEEGEDPGRQKLEFELDDAARELVGLADVEGGPPSSTPDLPQRLLMGLEEVGGQRLVEEWEQWPIKKIGWSRYGLLQVLLERPLEEETRLSEVLEMTTSQGRELGLKSLLEALCEEGKADFEVRDDVRKRAKKSVEKVDNGNRILEPFTQWEVAAHLAELFLEAMEWKLECPQARDQPIELRRDFRKSLRWDRQADRRWNRHADHDDTPSRGLLYPLRFRYLVFDFDHVEIGGPDGPWQEVATLRPQQKLMLARLLSGSPVLETSEADCSVGAGPGSRTGDTLRGHVPTDPGDHRAEGSEPAMAQRLSLPWTRPGMLEDFVSQNLASWPSELCLFSGNNAVVCYPHPKPPNRKLHLMKALSYPDYWATIVRCIEYGCELRTVAKLMEHETSDALEEASDCLFKLESGNGQDSKRKLQKKVEELRLNTALASRLVARLRNVAMPTTIARTDYAMSKLDVLSEVLAIGPVVDHVEKNLDLIERFLSHDESRSLQRKSTKLSLYMALAALFISMVTLPSSMNVLFEEGGALRTILAENTPVPPDVFGIVGLVTAPLIFLVVLAITVWFSRK